MIDDQLNAELRAARSMQALKVDFFDAYFTRKEAELIDAIKYCAVGNSDMLVNLHMRIKALVELQLDINTVIDTGELAQAHLNLKQK